MLVTGPACCWLAMASVSTCACACDERAFKLRWSALINLGTSDEPEGSIRCIFVCKGFCGRV